MVSNPILTTNSPTGQRSPAAAATARESAPRVYQEPTFRRHRVTKPDPVHQHSALSSELHGASHSTGQVRQDSAIDQYRFETGTEAQSSRSSISYSHQSPKDSQRMPSPTSKSYQPVSSASAYALNSVPQQGDTPSAQAALHPQIRKHSKSVSSGAPYLAASPRAHEPSTERTVPVDIRNGSDARPNITGPSSLPEQFFTQQNNFGTRQQRYNVRFAANYTSENMPTSQKPRNEPPTPPTASATTAEAEQPTSSPAPTSTTDETPASIPNEGSRPSDSHARATRENRDHSDREPSVERCIGCNEAWRRPIPDMDQGPLAPAENNADYMRLASSMIDRLRDQRKKADAAYEEWKWRHSRCYRPMSPHSTGSVDDLVRRSDLVSHADASTNGTANNKRKSEVPHESHITLKQRRVTSTSPAPSGRKAESSQIPTQE